MNTINNIYGMDNNQRLLLSMLKANSGGCSGGGISSLAEYQAFRSRYPGYPRDEVNAMWHRYKGSGRVGGGRSGGGRSGGGLVGGYKGERADKENLINEMQSAFGVPTTKEGIAEEKRLIKAAMAARRLAKGDKPRVFSKNVLSPEQRAANLEAKLLKRESASGSKREYKLTPAEEREALRQRELKLISKIVAAESGKKETRAELMALRKQAAGLKKQLDICKGVQDLDVNDLSERIKDIGDELEQQVKRHNARAQAQYVEKLLE